MYVSPESLSRLFVRGCVIAYSTTTSYLLLYYYASSSVVTNWLCLKSLFTFSRNNISSICIALSYVMFDDAKCKIRIFPFVGTK